MHKFTLRPSQSSGLIDHHLKIGFNRDIVKSISSYLIQHTYAATMARPYTSLLLSMLSRAADQGIERETFVEQYMLHYKQLYKYRHADDCAVETFDILYFLVEKDCWSFFCELETFLACRKGR